MEQIAELREGAEELVDRAIEMPAELVKVVFTDDHVARGGARRIT